MKQVIGKKTRRLFIAGTRITSVLLAVCMVILFAKSFINIESGKYTYQYFSTPIERKSVSYENSRMFKDILYDQIREITRMCVIRNQLEVNGVYDGKKVIDISSYANRMSVINNEDVTAQYYLDDLIKWGNYGFDYTTGVNGMRLLVPRYLSVEGKDLKDYAQTDEEYNTLVNNLQVAAQSLFQNYTEYTKYLKQYEDGNTNIKYCYRIVTDGQTSYYTNLKEDVRRMSTDDITSLFSGYQRFVAYNNDKMQISTNTLLDANNLRNAISAYEYSFEDNSRVWIAVGDTYPYSDILLEGKLRYEENVPYFWAALVIAAACVILHILAIGTLTKYEGRTCIDDRVIITLKKGDRVPLEIFILLCVICYMAAMMGGVACVSCLVDRTLGVSVVTVLFAVLALLCNIFFLALYLCLVRKIKSGRIFKDSLIAMLLRKIHDAFIETYDNGQLMTRTWLPYLLFLTMNLVLVLLGVFGIAIAFVMDMIIGGYLYKQNKERQRIIDVIEHIKSGDFSYKVEMSRMHGENRILANSVNSIGTSIQKAVETSMKDEKLKADLITNVSHDIKTPLTSIISYVDLIKREDLNDPKIQNYIQVLDAKSQRLKQLTDDLVEASKISSGNISLHFERINFVELINQSFGEFSEKFDQKGLTVIKNLPEKPVYIMADSRYIYRVIENLYNNIYKYALEGTRIYLDMEEDVAEKKVTLSIKNISAQPLNIKAEDLTERFIRGDVSRKTEGSGLGLSIAKNLTQALNGEFEICLDGDLFKVLLNFKTVE